MIRARLARLAAANGPADVATEPVLQHQLPCCPLPSSDWLPLRTIRTGMHSPYSRAPKDTANALMNELSELDRIHLVLALQVWGGLGAGQGGLCTCNHASCM